MPSKRVSILLLTALIWSNTVAYGLEHSPNVIVLTKSLYEDRFMRGWTPVVPHRTYSNNGRSYLIDSSGLSNYTMRTTHMNDSDLSAEQLARTGKLRKSLNILNHSISQGHECDTQTRLYLDRAVINADLGYYKQALSDCDNAKLLDKTPYKWKCLWIKSLILQQEGKKSESRAVLQKAVALAEDCEQNDSYARELRRQLAASMNSK